MMLIFNCVFLIKTYNREIRFLTVGHLDIDCFEASHLDILLISAKKLKKSTHIT